MIDLYYWPTPNGHKITMFLEEAGLEYRIVPVNIGAGAQFEPAFLAIAPNNRMPAIVDTAPQGGGAPLSVFESGAILLYLAEKSARLLPASCTRASRSSSGCSGRWPGLGPWRARTIISAATRPEKLPYAITRYVNETNRLYGVLDQRLAASPASSAGRITRSPTSPATRGSCPTRRRDRSSRIFRTCRRWFEAIRARPATARAYATRAGLSARRPP